MGFWLFNRFGDSRKSLTPKNKADTSFKRKLKGGAKRGYTASSNPKPSSNPSSLKAGSITAQAGFPTSSHNSGSNYTGGPSSYYHTPLHPQDFRAVHEDGGPNGAGRRRKSGDLTRLGAGLCVAALFGVIILKPTVGPQAVKKIATSTTVKNATRTCRAGGSVLTADFTDFENVLSISPLGGVTAPGEVLPAPYIRINTKNDGSPFERRMTPVRAPAQADIVALERRILHDEAGKNPKPSWTVHLKPCDGIGVVYERVDVLAPTLIEKAGGLAAFHEIGTPDHLARQTSIRVAASDILGEADGFDVALHDDRVEQQDLARPERYRKNPFARAEIFNVPPSLIAAITPDDSKSQCALDYLYADDRQAWSDKLGDAWGIRRAKGENACRTALIDLSGTAQGAWYTDAAHNGATTKISAIALAPDSIDPDRLILSLHGRLNSFTEAMIGRPSFSRAVLESTANADLRGTGVNDVQEKQTQLRLTDDFITLRKGSDRINRGFDEIRDDDIYCYEDMRMNFVGPRVNGVILLQKTSGKQALENSSQSDILKIEARNDITSCAEVDETISITAKATTFFR